MAFLKIPMSLQGFRKIGPIYLNTSQIQRGGGGYDEHCEIGVNTR